MRAESLLLTQLEPWHDVQQHYVDDLLHYNPNLPPIIVEPNGPDYTIRDGNHRYEAARQRGDQRIRCFVLSSEVADLRGAYRWPEITAAVYVALGYEDIAERTVWRGGYDAERVRELARKLGGEWYG